jgi:hypothetical protein
MEVVSIVIQRPLNPRAPVVKNEFEFIPLNFTQKLLNASEKILWSGELLSCQFRLHVPEKPEVRRCQVRTVRSVGYSNNQIINKKVLRGLGAMDVTVVKLQTWLRRMRFATVRKHCEQQWFQNMTEGVLCVVTVLLSHQIDDVESIGSPRTVKIDF